MENATVVTKIIITPELFILRVKPDLPFSTFFPGQYCALGLLPKDSQPQEKLIKRAYSIGSSADEKQYLEFYIALVPDGALTPGLFALNEGDRLYCNPKITGTFTLQELSPEKNLVLVATGTGLAPFMSMIRTKNTWDSKRKISIIHGVRFAKDLAYRDEINQYLKNNNSLSYYPVVSREEPMNNEFTKGYVQHLFENGTINLDPEKDNVFVCGNPAMIKDLETLLCQSKGYIVHSKKHPGNLHLEKYW